MIGNISKFLYRGTAYTAIISILFFIFAKLLDVSDLHLSFSRYLIILAFGMIVSATEFVFTFNKLPRIAQYFIHYFVLSIAFFFVFLNIRKSSGDFEFAPSTVFASLAVFTCFYFIILGIVFITKKAISKQEKKTNKKTNGKAPYQARFK